MIRCVPKDKPKPPSLLDQPDTIEDAELDLDVQKILDALKRQRSVKKKIIALETALDYIRMKQPRK